MSYFWKNKTVTVTGGNGFLGKHLIEKLKKKNCKKIYSVDHKIFDLIKEKDVIKMYKIQKPDIVFHLAACVGGIEINSTNPGKFFYQNAMMNLLVFHHGYLNKIKKFISIATVSVYPENSPLPFKEENIWEGYPENINAPYGIAKRITHVHSLSYRKQYNFNSIVLILTNLFGPNDNFNKKTSHVMAALIKRFCDAKKKKKKTVKVWSDGSATRDFCYIEDIADGIILAAEKYNKSEPVNLASGRETSIKTIANLIKKEIGYTGKISWDPKMPVGPRRRKISIEKAKNEFNYKVKNSLKEGVKKTINWYLNNNEKK
jgi:GDP-L-fucose synthase